jgi:ATP-binding protein involved in chromosome partitioning
MSKEYDALNCSIAQNMSGIRHKIAILSGKGGVGKTTLAVNIACCLSKISKVGLLDADISGPNIPLMTGLEGQTLEGTEKGITPLEAHKLKVMSMSFLLPGSDEPVIWRGPIKGNVIMQFLSDVVWGELDYLVVDLPPGTGDEALTIVQSISKLDGIIIVTTPQDVSLIDSRKAINFARKTGIPVIGLIENMSGLECPHCHKDIKLFGRGGGEKAADELGVQFLGSVPMHPEVVSSCDTGLPEVISKPNSAFSKSVMKIVKGIRLEVKDMDDEKEPAGPRKDGSGKGKQANAGKNCEE